MHLRTLGLAVAAVVLAVGPTSAHHSHGNYDMQRYTNLSGTVKEVHWMNPHSWVYLEVQDGKGETTVWALEGASVVQLQRRGWDKERVKVGDKIAVRCHQLRDGSNGCLLGYITTADGQEKIFD
jgi:hypothetical protein